MTNSWRQHGTPGEIANGVIRLGDMLESLGYKYSRQAAEAAAACLRDLGRLYEICHPPGDADYDLSDCRRAVDWLMTAADNGRLPYVAHSELLRLLAAAGERYDEQPTAPQANESPSLYQRGQRCESCEQNSVVNLDGVMTCLWCNHKQDAAPQSQSKSVPEQGLVKGLDHARRIVERRGYPQDNPSLALERIDAAVAYLRESVETLDELENHNVAIREELAKIVDTRGDHDEFQSLEKIKAKLQQPTAPQATCGWIRKSERLPTAEDADDNWCVWIWDGRSVGLYERWRVRQVSAVTHWLPRSIPAPPASVEGE